MWFVGRAEIRCKHTTSLDMMLSSDLRILENEASRSRLFLVVFAIATRSSVGNCATEVSVIGGAILMKLE